MWCSDHAWAVQESGAVPWSGQAPIPRTASAPVLGAGNSTGNLGVPCNPLIASAIVPAGTKARQGEAKEVKATERKVPVRLRTLSTQLPQVGVPSPFPRLEIRHLHHTSLLVVAAQQQHCGQQPATPGRQQHQRKEAVHQQQRHQQ